ncbi:hypothetical protein [Nisaea sp.]|uniref:hypothetical protein n=1 Tax=Nisaea sp. TaxID=2024842 RepID=UPI0032F00340
MKFLEKSGDQDKKSIFDQSVIWRVRLSADFAEQEGKRAKPHTAVVVESPYRNIALDAAHNALHQNKHKLDQWESITITICKQPKLPADTV